ncbi:hypothetical protein NC652_014904 [Populus alba x Populus x berolinensis]|nr:hypothetical protein NC652_014904 [Populus alba x Populus x berolinensis]
MTTSSPDCIVLFMRYILVFFLKDVYDLISIKQGRYALLGGKNMQKQYGRGVCSGGTRRKPVGLERKRKSREDEDVVAQLRRERRNYFLMLFN